MQTLKLYQQSEIEPTKIVGYALNTELFQALKIEEPPPVLFQKIQGEAAGYCLDGCYTAGGEIVISEEYIGLNRSVSESNARKGLTLIFIHEYVHRLITPQAGHSAVFAATNFALILRAENSFEALSNLTQFFQIYDFQDHQTENQALGIVDAFRFIIETGTELAESSYTAPEIAREVSQKWIKYEADVLSRPARLKAEKLAQDMIALNLKRDLNEANERKQEFFLYGVLACMICILLMFVIVKKYF